MRVRQEVGADKEQARALYRALGRSDNASLRDVFGHLPAGQNHQADLDCAALAGAQRA